MGKNGNLALYTLRILKYNFRLKISFAYPALRKKFKFWHQNMFFQNNQKLAENPLDQGQKALYGKKWKFSPV